MLFHMKLGKIVLPRPRRNFLFRLKASLQVNFHDAESKTHGLLVWFDFWITFLRDEINLPLKS